MPAPKKIINFLEKNKIKYEVLKHKTVYTAHDKAATLKVPEKIVGKTLILKRDGKLIFALISADKNLDKNKFKKISKAKKIEFATEKLIKNKFKGVRVGTVPPFGNLWGIPTIADSSLKKEKEIILNGGDWQYSIKISPKDLEKLVPDLIWQKISKKK